MSNLNKLDFAPLEASGQGYHKWVRDINNHLTAQGILAAIQPPNPDVIAQNVPAMAVTNNAKALILITRHMVESLQLEYMHEDNARNLWVALEERFGNVCDAILPDLEVRWNSLRFSDFKTVQEYYSEALNIRSQMHFCKKTLTDAQMIEKTLSTFPVDALLIARNYRIDVTAERITRFHELITAMSIAEKHDNILVKNYNSRPVGTKVIPESNYNRCPRGGRGGRGARGGRGGRRGRNHRGRSNYSGNYTPYDRPAQESNHQNNVWTRGGGNNRGKRGGNTGHSAAANTDWFRRVMHLRIMHPNPKEFPHNDARFVVEARSLGKNLQSTGRKWLMRIKAYRNLREAHFMNHEDRSINLTPKTSPLPMSKVAWMHPEFE
ncbi:ZINC FINGER CCHC-TYPE-RELATED [Salix viminalis]|uniref:ZINC FINGER CCHC-TYPE-RELATED n=1 Tax=Salix viminalis TaxID=40686 RepID=A0A9Q0SP47_SALVM|nr:ZINC FINGER CCHC-TYPE-RELATED [Salix viminalis]